MRYIGLDLASCSGWAFFEDDRLLERGTIQLMSQMDLPQKLHYFHLELKNLLTRLKPEYAFIEDVLLGISGAKTLAFLARLNGIAINVAYEVLQNKVKLYYPTYWKANSGLGLSGMAKKWQIQLSIIQKYNIPITGNFDNINQDCREYEDRINLIKCTLEAKRDIDKKQTAIALKKKNQLNDELIIIAQKNAIDARKSIQELKIRLKNEQVSFDKRMIKISTDITSQTGMSSDVCDACGVARCGWLEIIGNE